MINIAICDDDPQSIEHTKSMLDTWSTETGTDSHILCFKNGDDLLTKTMTQRFDIVFLDIVMPFLNGIDVAKELRTFDQSLKIVFLSASSQFAIDSYATKAIDYCLKPLTYSRLKEVMDACLQSMDNQAKSITLKTKGGYQRVFVHDIEYIEAQNKRVLFFFRGKDALAVSESFHYFQSKLATQKEFFKCHRSYLVYIPNVENFNNSRIMTKSGRILPIARGFTKPFQAAYFSVFFDD